VNVNNPWPALIVGLVLIASGTLAIRSHIRSWRRQQNDPTFEDRDREYYQRRYRRRMQMSAILVILGFLIGAGDVLLPFQKAHPGPVAMYWIGVLLLTGWLILLGFGDLISTMAYGRIELARVQQKHRDLERQVVEFKHRLENPGSEGAPPSPT
jgi:drug/metabolite transporter (DMT)-like permease